ncbi:MAG: hypothetical protein LWW86_04930 [Micrococcales bacterium]|nr:hypothetical protein [Micrococcales bacterium]
MRLDELMSEVAERVSSEPVTDEQAYAAWSRGRRARRRGQVLTGLSSVAVLLLVAALVWPLLGFGSAAPPAETNQTGVQRSSLKYPQRLDPQIWVRGLPDSPGPMAGWGALQADSTLSTFVFDEAGRRYGLPRQNRDVFPALSPDGRWLAWMNGESYELRDLVTGKVVPIRDIGIGASDGTGDTTSTKYGQSGQMPIRWSPDGRHLAVPVVTAGFDAGIAVVSTDGSLVFRRLAATEGEYEHLAGWADASHLVVAHYKALTTDADTEISTTLRTIDVRIGNVSRSVACRCPLPCAPARPASTPRPSAATHAGRG